MSRLNEGNVLYLAFSGVLAGPSLKSYSIQDKAGVESMCCFCVQQGPTLVNRVLLDWLGFLQYLFFHISW